MGYDVEYPKSVEKQLDAMPAWAAKALRDDFEKFAADPLANGIDVRKLKGKNNLYRIRCGDYRLIFERNKATNRLQALRASDRKDAY